MSVTEGELDYSTSECKNHQFELNPDSPTGVLNKMDGKFGQEQLLKTIRTLLPASSSRKGRVSKSARRASQSGAFDAESADGSEMFKWYVKTGAWVSELAVWMEWHTKGSLIATSGSHLLTLQSEDLKHVLGKFPIAESCVAIYVWSSGCKFKQMTDDAEEVSDVVRVQVNTISEAQLEVSLWP